MRNENFYKATNMLKKIGQLDGMSLAFDEKNQCVFRVGHKYDVVLQANESFTLLKIVAYVADQKYQGQKELLEMLMVCNFYSSELQGCAIGLCHKTNRFVLSIEVPLSHSSEQYLANVVTNFHRTLVWSDQQIESFAKNNTPSRNQFSKNQNFLNRSMR